MRGRGASGTTTRAWWRGVSVGAVATGLLGAVLLLGGCEGRSGGDPVVGSGAADAEPGALAAYAPADSAAYVEVELRPDGATARDVRRVLERVGGDDAAAEIFADSLL